MGDKPNYTPGQPAPMMVANAVSSHDLAAEDMHSLYRGGQAASAIVVLMERKRHGLEEYGVVLHHANGRDHSKDAMEEAADLVVYLRTWLSEHRAADGSHAEEYRIERLYQEAMRTLIILADYQRTGRLG